MRVRWIVQADLPDEADLGMARQQLSGIVEVLTGGGGRVVYEEVSRDGPEEEDTSRPPKLRLVSPIPTPSEVTEDAEEVR